VPSWNLLTRLQAVYRLAKSRDTKTTKLTYFLAYSALQIDILNQIMQHRTSLPTPTCLKIQESSLIKLSIVNKLPLLTGDLSQLIRKYMPGFVVGSHPAHWKRAWVRLGVAKIGD
jgi:hypothetical protein